MRCSAITSNRCRNSRSVAGLSLERQEVGDQLVDRLLGQIDVRVAQQRHQVVGVGPHPRVLEVDDVELTVVQHQVAAVIVAVAEHPRLGRELCDDDGELLAQRVARSPAG